MLTISTFWKKEGLLFVEKVSTIIISKIKFLTEVFMMIEVEQSASVSYRATEATDVSWRASEALLYRERIFHALPFT